MYDLTIKVGNTYKNRKGETVKIIGMDDSNTNVNYDFKFYDSKNQSYTETGKFSRMLSELDLIEEVRDDFSLNLSNKALKLGLNKSYKDREGRLRTIVSYIPEQYANVLDERWYANGKAKLDGETPYDLIEEVNLDSKAVKNRINELKNKIYQLTLELNNLEVAINGTDN